MLDTTKTNHLIVERFHDDEMGEKNLLSMHMMQNTARKGNPNYIMTDTKVKFQESMDTLWTVSAHSVCGKRTKQQTKCSELLCK